MNTTIFTWNDTNYRAIYTKQLKENPLYYDPNLKVWVAYSYEYCKALLLDTHAHVPEHVIDGNSPLNNTAKLLLGNMARLSNDQQHEESRGAAMNIFQKINQAAVDKILEGLLSQTNTKAFDWVEVIARRMPILVILRGLNFSDVDSDRLISNLASLPRIMSPIKTAEDAETINSAVNIVYEIAKRHIVSSGFAAETQEITELVNCNLVGLFIQCYDAGWGLLSSTLLSFAAYQSQGIKRNDASFYKELVTETLRWDPPVHNTRRVAIKDISLGGQIIREGETIMIVLAAANLDPKVFKDPDEFDTSRFNSEQHLTFGLGGHSCIAKYLCINMAAETCSFLANKYQNIIIMQKEFSYEPKLNARLLKQLMTSLS